MGSAMSWFAWFHWFSLVWHSINRFIGLEHVYRIYEVALLIHLVTHLLLLIWATFFQSSLWPTIPLVLEHQSLLHETIRTLIKKLGTQYFLWLQFLYFLEYALVGLPLDLQRKLLKSLREALHLVILLLRKHRLRLFNNQGPLSSVRGPLIQPKEPILKDLHFVNIFIFYTNHRWHQRNLLLLQLLCNELALMVVNKSSRLGAAALWNLLAHETARFVMLSPHCLDGVFELNF